MKRLTLLIAAVVTAWLLVVSFKADIDTRFAAWSSRRAHEGNGNDRNPLFPEMQKVASSFGVDVSFIRRATHAREIDLGGIELFTKRPGYYDVIVFGDSSLIWSFSPQIVAQVAGERVAFLGYESALPNRSFIPFAEQICDVYLKKGGIAVFLFDFWFVDPTDPQRTRDMLRLTSPSNASVWRQELERTADSILGLPHLAVYGSAVEPFFAPERYRQKHLGAQGMGCAFYSWGARSDAVFLHCGRDNGEANPFEAHPVNLEHLIVDDCTKAGASNVVANLAAIGRSSIPIKAIANPFSEAPNRDLVCAVKSQADHLRLLDLPRIAVKTYGIKSLDYQLSTHLANTSSIPASVVLGRAIADLRSMRARQ